MQRLWRNRAESHGLWEYWSGIPKWSWICTCLINHYWLSAQELTSKFSSPEFFYSPMLWEIVFHLDKFQLRKVLIKWWFHLVVQNHSGKLPFLLGSPIFDPTFLSPSFIRNPKQCFSILCFRTKLVPISSTETPRTLGRCWTIWGMANWCSTRTWQRKVMAL